MIAVVSNLLKGRSSQEISGHDPDKLKSVQKIQAVLHLTRIVLVLLGITLTVLGVAGILGTPGLIAGGVLLLTAFCLIMPLFIKKVTKQPVVDNTLFEKVWNELAEVLQKLKKDALTDPELNKFLIDCKKNTIVAVDQCDVKEFSKDFYMPLFFWHFADQLPKTVKISDQDKVSIQAGYLLVIQGLKKFQKLTDIAKTHPRSAGKFQQDRAMAGALFSDGSIALTLSTKNCGMQVVRGGLRILYGAYLSVRNAAGSEPFMTPGTPYYEMRTLYNDALAQCAKVFSVEELKNLNSIKNEKSTDDNRAPNMRNGDLLIQVLTHPDNNWNFRALQFLDSNLGRGGQYDLLFG